MYRLILYLHILGAFGFMLGHGAAAGSIFLMRRERNRERIAGLLTLARSHMVTGMTWGSTLLFLVTGITLGFMGRWWSSGWIWAALGIFVGLGVVMGYFGRGAFDPLISGLGLPLNEGAEPEVPDQPLTEQELETLLGNGRPWLLTVTGLFGWAAILWLMMFKPF